MTENKQTKSNLFISINEAIHSLPYDVIFLADGVYDLTKYSSNKQIKKLLNALALVIHFAKVGIIIFQKRNLKAIVLYGFSTEFLWITYLCSIFNSRNVYLIVHHNIQQASQHKLMRWLMKLYYKLGYNFIVHETLLPLKDIGFCDKELSRYCALLHPINPVISQPNQNSSIDMLLSSDDRIKIGVVGNIRKGKSFHQTVKILSALKEELNFSLIIGTNDVSQFSYEDAIIIDTSTYDNYILTLLLCDIIVLNYEESEYFFRCSGVAADAIGAKCYIVCSDFPLMSYQISYPKQIGTTYKDTLDIKIALKATIALGKPSENKLFEDHYIERSTEKIASVLDAFIRKQSIEPI